MHIRPGKMFQKASQLWLILLATAGCTPIASRSMPTITPTSTSPAAASTSTPEFVDAPTVTQTAFNCPPSSHHTVEIIDRLPHDAGAYTQGLVFLDGFFYESTGLLGESSLRKIHPQTGEVIQIQQLPSDLFGEGLALVKYRFIQLTWKNNQALVYQQDDFKLVRKFSYNGEGWGLTFDGQHLIMSDGSSLLRFLNPDTFKEDHRLTVLDGNTPVERINELEMVNGSILANIWQTNQIIAIDPQTGCISAWVNLDSVVSEAIARPGAEVLNGIAFDSATSRLWVTGKRWATVFEIKIQPELK